VLCNPVARCENSAGKNGGDKKEYPFSGRYKIDRGVEKKEITYRSGQTLKSLIRAKKAHEGVYGHDR
jgi:hypothetical protein